MIKTYLMLIVSLLVSFSALAQTETFRLTDFYSGDGVIRLQGKADAIDVPIPLSAATRVNSATLRIEVTSSQALIKKRSQLYIRFNNATIGQVAYDPDRPSLVSEINIPTALWRPGFNSLTLAVSQHYAMQCVDGNAPELWSEVNVYNSTLTLDTAVGDKPFMLESLSHFFNPGIGGQRKVALYTALEPDTSIYQKTLPLAAQALALRNQYQPLHVKHAAFADNYELPDVSELLRGTSLSDRVGNSLDRSNATSKALNDEFWNEENIARFERSAWYVTPQKQQPIHVLVGTVEELSPVLSDDLVNEIDGAFLKTQNTPAFIVNNTVVIPASLRLIVSGTTQEEVYEAAKALSVMDDAINPITQVTVLSQSEMDASKLQKHKVLTPDNTYTFQDFGVATAQFRNEGDFRKRVPLRLPADFYVPENASVKLLLDFGYGAGFGPGSVMNVSVNGELVHGLALNNINGQSFRDYQLTIPARFFKGGINNIDFDVTQRAPLAGVECDDIPGSHLVFQLDDSSAIKLPDAGHVAVQPNLALMSETAYPFARFKSAPASTINIPTEAFLDSALTLSAKLAQVAQVPLLNVEVALGNEINTSTSAFVLGTPESLSSVEQAEFSTAIEATKRWSYRLQNNLYNRIRNFTEDKSFKEMRIDGHTVQQSDLGEQAVLTAQRHPTATNSDTLFIVAAQTPDLLEARILDLVSLSLWGQLGGDFFAWKNSQTPSLVMQVSDKFEVGEADDKWLHLRLWLSNNPWYWLFGFIALVVVVSVITYLLLKRRNQQVQDSW